VGAGHRAGVAGAGRGRRVRVRQGIRAAVVHEAVYPLAEPASHYYQVMTRSAWMPALVDERI